MELTLPILKASYLNIPLEMSFHLNKASLKMYGPAKSLRFFTKNKLSAMFILKFGIKRIDRFNDLTYENYIS